MIIYSDYLVKVSRVLHCVILFFKPLALFTLFHNNYIKCICSQCFREGITKFWIYYHFCHKEWEEKLTTSTVVNKYFDNEQKYTNDSVRKEEIADFKKRQRKKE